MNKHVVCMYVDELASCMSTPASEYREIELDLREYIFGEAEVDFVVDVNPFNIQAGTTVYVIDFGALAYYGSGFEWKADRFSWQLLQEIKDKPNTFFILWSSFTVSSYKYIACEDKGLYRLTDLDKPANVFFMDSFSLDQQKTVLDKIRVLLGLPKPVIDKDKYITKRLENTIVDKEEDNDIFSADE